MSETPTRIVPGAPPPAPLSKSQKKKRKGAKGVDSEAASPLVVSTPLEASQLEAAPTAAQIKQHLVAPQLTTSVSVDAQSAVDDSGHKQSPLVELVHKRLKATAKKIVSSDQF